MTAEQEKHLDDIKYASVKHVDAKYRKGQEEHGGALWNKSGILKNLVDETPDFVTYSYVLKDQLIHIKNLLDQGKPQEALKWLTAVLSDKIEEIVDN